MRFELYFCSTTSTKACINDYKSKIDRYVLNYHIIIIDRLFNKDNTD